MGINLNYGLPIWEKVMEYRRKHGGSIREAELAITAPALHSLWKEGMMTMKLACLRAGLIPERLNLDQPAHRVARHIAKYYQRRHIDTLIHELQNVTARDEAEARRDEADGVGVQAGVDEGSVYDVEEALV